MPDCPPWCSTAHEPAQPHRHTEHGVTLLQAPGDTVPRIVVHYGPNRGAYTPTAARTLADVARMAGHTEHADALQAAAATAEAATPNRDIDESSLPVAADVWAALDDIAERPRRTSRNTPHPGRHGRQEEQGMTGDFADLVIYYGSAAGPKGTPWLLAELTRHLPHGRIPLTWVAAFADYRIGEVQNRLVEELEGEVLGRGLHPDELTYIEYLPEECPAALCRAPDRNGTVVVAVVHGPEGGEP